MRSVVSTLAVAALIAGSAVVADASAQESRKYRDYDDRYDRYSYRDDAAYRAFRRFVPGYQARNPDNFKFGTPEWWKAMDLEGRGGHRF